MTKIDYIHYDGDPKEYDEKYEQWLRENPKAKVKEVLHENVDVSKGKMRAKITYDIEG